MEVPQARTRQGPPLVSDVLRRPVIVLLDTSTLGVLTNPRGSPEHHACNRWLRALRVRRVLVFIPAITDYELRREFMLRGSTAALARADRIERVTGYLPITKEVMRRAATPWAEARRRGRLNADPAALDGDVILAAQAQLLSEMGHEVIVATTNVGHLSQLVDARSWQEIAVP